MNSPRIKIELTTLEIAAIAARAEVERTLGEPGVWSELWKRIQSRG